MYEPEDIEDRLRALERQLQALRRHVFDARALDDELPDARFRVLCCRTARERVAFLLQSVHEVVPRAALAALPDAPPWVLGILSLRGAMIPVIDVGARLSGERSPVRLGDFILVVAFEERKVGLLVQDVHELVEVDRADVHPPPRDVAAGPYVQGVIHVGDRPQLLLSVGKLLHASDVLELDSPKRGADEDDDGHREPAAD